MRAIRGLSYLLFIVHVAFAIFSLLFMDTDSNSTVARFFANDVIDGYELMGFGSYFIGLILVTHVLVLIIVVARRKPPGTRGT